MIDENKLKKYMQKGFSTTLIAISVSSDVHPETILDYVKVLKQLTN